MLKIREFAKSMDDRLNPVLVKEIRQQLRSNSFVITFLAFQFFLLIGALVSLLDEKAVSIFWYVLVFWLYVVIPFRAFFIVRGEYYDNTLEPILLTKLKPERVVWGKFWSLFLQNVMVMSSILPYIVIRYFLGGVELLVEISLIILAFLGGFFALTWMIIISVFQKIVFGIPLIVISFLTFIIGSALFTGGIYGGLMLLIEIITITWIALATAPYQSGSVFKRPHGNDPLRYGD